MVGVTGGAAALRDQVAGHAQAVARRDFILALIGICAGVPAYAADALQDLRPPPEALGAWLRTCGNPLFADLPALRRLGATYLLAHPEEDSCAALSRLLIAGRDGPIVSRLLSAIDHDWSRHHVTVVDGWLLARSEARLCAAVHLEERLHP